ncbi:MAG: hypothetical protein WC383_16395, partial [Gammaproteobacteria bacterium]
SLLRLPITWRPLPLYHFPKVSNPVNYPHFVKCVGLTPKVFTAKCGVKMPREVAISSPGSGWEAVVKVVKRSQTVLKQS